MALVVQKVDGAIHGINHCPANKYKQKQLSYLVDSRYVQYLTNNWATRSIAPFSTNNYYEPVSLSFCDLLKDAQV